METNVRDWSQTGIIRVLLILGIVVLASSAGILAGHAAPLEPVDPDPAWHPTPPPLPFPRPNPPGAISAQSTRVQIPAIDHQNGWETWIQVQNVGQRPAKTVAFLWESYSAACPPAVPGPLTAVCTGLLAPGAAWSWTTNQLPAVARSGIVYSVPPSEADEACERAFLARGSHFAWRGWEREFAGRGEPIAVTVNRIGPGLTEDLVIASAYSGISGAMLGVRDPLFGGFMYYAPFLTHGLAGFDSQLIIQNGGDECTSVEIWYQPQDECQRAVVHTIGALAPGEALRTTPDGLPVGSQGSAWIRASQPLGIVVDHWGDNFLTTFRGVPADSAGVDFTAGAAVNYVPLTYREFNGWETSIHVQNLSSTNSAKVKVVFLDNSGNTIATAADWICPRGSREFFLPALNDLPGQYVGAAIVTSQGWFSPGAPAVSAARITSVVTLINRETGQAVSYNALTPQETQGNSAVGIPLLLQNRRGITTQIAIQNLNPNPGSTTLQLIISDFNGPVEQLCFSLAEGQVIYFDLADIRILNQGFRGSAVIAVASSRQRGQPAIGAIMVERGTWPGDQSKATEGIPVPGVRPPRRGYGCR